MLTDDELKDQIEHAHSRKAMLEGKLAEHVSKKDFCSAFLTLDESCIIKMIQKLLPEPDQDKAYSLTVGIRGFIADMQAESPHEISELRGELERFADQLLEVLKTEVFTDDQADLFGRVLSKMHTEDKVVQSLQKAVDLETSIIRYGKDLQTFRQGYPTKGFVIESVGDFYKIVCGDMKQGQEEYHIHERFWAILDKQGLRQATGEFRINESISITSPELLNIARRIQKGINNNSPLFSSDKDGSLLMNGSSDSNALAVVGKVLNRVAEYEGHATLFGSAIEKRSVDLVTPEDYTVFISAQLQTVLGVDRHTAQCLSVELSYLSISDALQKVFSEVGRENTDLITNYKGIIENSAAIMAACQDRVNAKTQAVRSSSNGRSQARRPLLLRNIKAGMQKALGLAVARIGGIRKSGPARQRPRNLAVRAEKVVSSREPKKDQ